MIATKPLQHGYRNTYRFRKCRCDWCRAANAAYVAACKAKREHPKEPVPRPTKPLIDTAKPQPLVFPDGGRAGWLSIKLHFCGLPGRRVVTPNIQRRFAGVESLAAQFGAVLRVRFADLVLEATAFPVLVKSLVGFHASPVSVCVRLATGLMP